MHHLAAPVPVREVEGDHVDASERVGPPDATDVVRYAWPEVVAGEGRVQAWLLGSGVDPEADDDQPEAILKALEAGEPCVLDAGGITVLVDELRTQQHWTGGGPDRAFVGEPTERESVERRPYRHAHRAAELTGATVLLKGSTTLVVRPDGLARSQAEATSWLATAGAGDVLAGIAGALLAGGLAPFEAGSLAALVHGLAATAASGGGPIVSGDVAAHLPTTIAALLQNPP